MDEELNNRWHRWHLLRQSWMHQRVDLQGRERQVEVRAFSIQAASGTLLQYAKAGISIVFGSPAAAKGGRTFGALTLSEVIWFGRNQAHHWEDAASGRPLVLVKQHDRCLSVTAPAGSRQPSSRPTTRGSEISLYVCGLLISIAGTARRKKAGPAVTGAASCLEAACKLMERTLLHC